MSHSLFFFGFDKKLDSQLRADVRLALRKQANTESEIESSLQTLLGKRPRHLRLASFIRLKILHRQFSRSTVPGLPIIVMGARFLYGKYRYFKKTFPVDT